MENKLVQSLVAARNSLTTETWRKGAYFQAENETLCMCAHGAVQAQVNPACKLEVNKDNATDSGAQIAAIEASTPEGGAVGAAFDAALETEVLIAAAANIATITTATAETAGAAFAANVVAAEIASVVKIWNNRPDWVKQDHISLDRNYGNKDAHYLLGMVGLTASFNDAKTTTLEMVHQKFDKAIELARSLQ